MAITIQNRPRQLFYYTSDSPAVPVYSNFNATWNPIVYSFAVLSSDILSSIILQIYEIGSNTLLASVTMRPFRTGTWNVDISPYIKSYLFSKYETNFTTADNYIDKGNTLNFYITYTQNFDNGNPSVFNSEQSRPISATCSAMQFGDVNGGNMAKYVPFNFNFSEDKKMKFLSVFEKPVMWASWPFTLSFIYSLNIIGVQVLKKEVQQDSNKAPLQTDEYILDPAQIGKINYLKIRQPSQPNAQSILVSLITGDPIESLYVDEGYVDDGYTQII